MEIYENEQDQIDALKAWWDKYGTRLIIALLVVLALAAGWRFWLDRSHREAEAASALYMKLTEVVMSEPDQAMEIGRQLINSHPSSTYAAMASLAMASINVEKGEHEAAAAQLRWTVENGEQEELVETARLRLGRVLLAMGKGDEALTLIGSSENASFRPSFDELRGDILLSQGKRAEARDAYSNALAGFNGVPSRQGLLQMKIDDLADAQGSQS